MIKNSEIAMISSANYALEYQDKNPGADTEEIIQRVIENLDALETKRNLKIFGIAAASEALKLKKENKHKTNRQILQMFMNVLKSFSEKVSAELKD